MRVERVGVDAVKEKLDGLKRKMEDAKVGEAALDSFVSSPHTALFLDRWASVGRAGVQRQAGCAAG